MATIGLYELFSIYVTVDGSNNVTAIADQSVNGHNLTEGSSTNGGVFSLGSFGGYPSILMDGTDDYLAQNSSTGLANAMVGGNDNSFCFHMAMQHITDGTSGDPVIGCGDSVSDNAFFRLTEGTTGSWTCTKRDNATSAGGGAGIVNVGASGTTQQIVEVEHTGTAVSLFTWRKPQSITTVASGTASDVATLGTIEWFAVGTLKRSGTPANFGNFRWAYLHVLDAVPTSTERDALRNLAARYTSAPRLVLSRADRIKRDRHLHKSLRPTTWKLSKNGVLLPAADWKAVQVNGFAAERQQTDASPAPGVLKVAA